jgi:hypothetical protein
VELVGLGETATASGCSEQDPERDCKEKETQTN